MFVYFAYASTESIYLGYRHNFDFSALAAWIVKLVHLIISLFDFLSIIKIQKIKRHKIFYYIHYTLEFNIQEQSNCGSTQEFILCCSQRFSSCLRKLCL